MTDLIKKLEKTRKIAEKRGMIVPAEPENIPVQGQLPLWPEPVRGIPNSVLRSALFGAIRRGRRTYLQAEKIASFENITILQTGPRLDQADLDVWEQCLHLARTDVLGTEISFSAYGFLKAIGRATGGRDIEWLKNAFRRLSASVVEITEGKRAYYGPMLYGGVRDDETGDYIIQINPNIIKLYGTDGWSSVEYEQRKSLKGQPLAQWLHGFYSSHADPYPIKVETIYKLCGSETKLLKNFRATLRESLRHLETVTGWSASIDDKDLVRVVKTGTASQNRHLLRKVVKNITN